MSAPDSELTVAWQRWITSDTGLLDGLLARHREPHRRYHTATHVRWVLRHVDTLRTTERVDQPCEVVAAAFYHDAVYIPTRGDNEHVSAQLARRELSMLDWSAASPGRLERVAAMIEATAHLGGGGGGDGDGGGGVGGEHAPRTPLDTDTAVLLDADLAVLGAEPAAYAAYATGVRQEYVHVEHGAWRIGRGAVIEGFLARAEIFSTATGRARWERPARANLAAELASLR